jgi:integrase
MAKGRRPGSVLPHGEGKWRIRWYKGETNGKRVYGSEVVEAPSKREADKKLRAKLAERDSGVVVEPTKESVAEYLERWLEQAARQKVRARTLADYRYMIARYVTPNVGAIRLQKLRTSDVQGLVGALVAQGLGPRTVRIACRILKSALGQAVRWKELARNPAEGVELPKGEHQEMQALSAEEVGKLRKELAGTRFAVLFDVMLGTGMRPSEVLGLRWQDVDFEAGTLQVVQVLSRRRGSEGVKGEWEFAAPKTKRSRRTIPIPRELVEALRRHKAVQAAAVLKRPLYQRGFDLVFADRLGGPLSLRNIARRHFKPALERAKLPATIRLYDLRHTVATLLLQAGEPVKVVSERLGHTSAAMVLDVYGHVLPGMQKSATETLGRLVFTS